MYNLNIPPSGIRRRFMKDLTMGVVFVEGVLSFLSPCFLPLIPIYIGYLAGEAVGEKRRWNVLKNSLAFVAGFSLVFIILGAAASGVGKYLISHRDIFNKILGGIVVLMGLFYMGILKINILNMEKRFSYEGKKGNIPGAFLLGIAIGFGWTPCIGPILASVLAVAASKSSLIEGVYLLFIYSMGIAVPFLITALLVQGAAHRLRKILKYTKVIKIISGVILVAAGILLYTGYFERLSGLLWR